MAAVFALTTPFGIALGIGIRSTYNANSSTALAVNGVLESVRALRLCKSCHVLNACSASALLHHPPNTGCLGTGAADNQRALLPRD